MDMKTLWKLLLGKVKKVFALIKVQTNKSVR